jgi:hypothetical protein
MYPMGEISGGVGPLGWEGGGEIPNNSSLNLDACCSKRQGPRVTVEVQGVAKVADGRGVIQNAG